MRGYVGYAEIEGYKYRVKEYISCKHFFVMKQLILLVLSVCLLTACKKDTPEPSQPVHTNTSPYYFRFSLDGTDHKLEADFPQYAYFYTDEIGGYQMGQLGFYPSIGLKIIWNSKDTVQESDVLALKGKTLRFSDTAIRPELTFEPDGNYTDTWRSADTATNNYSISISDISYLKKDTTLNHPLRVYIIKGTCRAAMQKESGKTSVLDNGEFNMVISMRDEH